MKLGIYFATVIGAEKTGNNWLKKEWEVQDAYFAGDEIVLSDPTVRKGFDYFTVLSGFVTLEAVIVRQEPILIHIQPLMMTL